MKSLLLLLALGAALTITGCNSSSTKDSGSESTGQSAPSRSDRY